MKGPDYDTRGQEGYDPQDFFDDVAPIRNATIERLVGLLTGTNEEDDNMYQVLDDFAWQVKNGT